MIDILRKSLELFRLIPRSDLLARVTPTHPTPDQIVPGEMTIVRDGVDILAGFALTPEALGAAPIADEAQKLMVVMNLSPLSAVMPNIMSLPGACFY